MSEIQTMVRTEIMIDGNTVLLAQDQDVDSLKRRFEEAAASTGRFVDFVVVGNRRMSVLATPRTRVVVSIATTQFDPRDTGDETAPFGGVYDSGFDLS